MPGYDVNVNQLAVGATPLTFNVGYDLTPKWLVVNNNDVFGNSTGPSLVITVTPFQAAPFVVPYGEVRHFYLAGGLKWFTIAGNGAFVTCIVADHDVPMEDSTVLSIPAGVVTVTGGVNTNATIVSPLTGAGSVKVFPEPA